VGRGEVLDNATGADGWRRDRLEYVLAELKKNARLADTSVPHQDNLVRLAILWRKHLGGLNERRSRPIFAVWRDGQYPKLGLWKSHLYIMIDHSIFS
jgi:hypothetical protein